MCVWKLSLPEVPLTAMCFPTNLSMGFSTSSPNQKGGGCSLVLELMNHFFSGLEGEGFGKPLVIQRVVVSNSLNLML